MANPLKTLPLYAKVQALMNGVECDLQPVRDPQLVEDVVQVVLDGLFADEHFLGHFLVFIALGDQLYYLPLALAEGRTLAGLAGTAANLTGRSELPHDGRRSVRIQPDLASMYLADALHNQFRRSLFEHDARTAQFHSLHEFVLIFGGRQYDHAGALVGLLQSLQ